MISTTPNDEDCAAPEQTEEKKEREESEGLNLFLELIQNQERLKRIHAQNVKEMEDLRAELEQQTHINSLHIYHELDELEETMREENEMFVKESIATGAVESMKDQMQAHKDIIAATLNNFSTKIHCLEIEQKKVAGESSVSPIELEEIVLQKHINEVESQLTLKTYESLELSRLIRSQEEGKAAILRVLEKSRRMEIAALRALKSHQESTNAELRDINELSRKEVVAVEIKRQYDRDESIRRVNLANRKSNTNPSKSKRRGSSAMLDRLSMMNVTKKMSEVDLIEAQMTAIAHQKEEQVFQIAKLIEDGLVHLAQAERETASYFHELHDFKEIYLNSTKDKFESQEDFMQRQLNALGSYSKQLEKIEKEVDAKHLNIARRNKCKFDEIIQRYSSIDGLDETSRKALIKEALTKDEDGETCNDNNVNSSNNNINNNINNNKGDNSAVGNSSSEYRSIYSSNQEVVAKMKQDLEKSGNISIRLLSCTELQSRQASSQFKVVFTMDIQSMESKYKKSMSPIFNEIIKDIKWNGTSTLRCQVVSHDNDSNHTEHVGFVELPLANYNLEFSSKCTMNLPLQGVSSGRLQLEITLKRMKNKERLMYIKREIDLYLKNEFADRHKVSIYQDSILNLRNRSGVSLGAYSVSLLHIAASTPYIIHKSILSPERCEILRMLYMIDCIVRSMHKSKVCGSKKGGGKGNVLDIDLFSEYFVQAHDKRSAHLEEVLHFEEMELVASKLKEFGSIIMCEIMNRIGSFILSPRSGKEILRINTYVLAIVHILLYNPQSNDNKSSSSLHTVRMKFSEMDKISAAILEMINDQIESESFFDDNSIAHITRRLRKLIESYADGESWCTSFLKALTELDTKCSNSFRNIHKTLKEGALGGNARLKQYHENLYYLDHGVSSSDKEQLSSEQTSLMLDHQNAILLYFESLFVEVGGGGSPLREVNFNLTKGKISLSSSIATSHLFKSCCPEIIPAVIMVSLLRRGMDAKSAYTSITGRITDGTKDTQDLQFLYNRQVHIPEGIKKFAAPSPRKIELKSNSVVLRTKNQEKLLAAATEEELLHNDYVNRQVSRMTELCDIIRGMLLEASNPESNSGIFKLPEYLRYSLNNYLETLKSAASVQNYNTMNQVIREFDSSLEEIISVFKSAQDISRQLCKPLEDKIRLYKRVLTDMGWGEANVITKLSDFELTHKKLRGMVELLQEQLQLKLDHTKRYSSKKRVRDFPLGKDLLHALLDPDRDPAFELLHEIQCVRDTPATYDLRSLEPYLYRKVGDTTVDVGEDEDDDDVEEENERNERNLIKELAEKESGGWELKNRERMKESKNPINPSGVIEIKKDGMVTVPDDVKLSVSNRTKREAKKVSHFNHRLSVVLRRPKVARPDVIQPLSKPKKKPIMIKVEEGKVLKPSEMLALRRTPDNEKESSDSGDDSVNSNDNYNDDGRGGGGDDSDNSNNNGIRASILRERGKQGPISIQTINPHHEIDNFSDFNLISGFGNSTRSTTNRNKYKAPQKTIEKIVGISMDSLHMFSLIEGATYDLELGLLKEELEREKELRLKRGLEERQQGVSSWNKKELKGRAFAYVTCEIPEWKRRAQEEMEETVLRLCTEEVCESVLQEALIKSQIIKPNIQRASIAQKGSAKKQRRTFIVKEINGVKTYIRASQIGMELYSSQRATDLLMSNKIEKVVAIPAVRTDTQPPK